jgi:hypothetical protein
MFDPIDPKELQQALYASAAAVGSVFTSEIKLFVFFIESQSPI